MARHTPADNPNERFYIKLSYANAFDPKTKRHRYGVWPILFKTKLEAEVAMENLPTFANAAAGAIPGRPKIKSTSIERKVVR